MASLLIFASLVLPQRYCINNGQLEIHYPLSASDSVLSVVLIASFYTLPFLLLFFTKRRIIALAAGIAICGAGLYFISYGATMAATQLLLGWYTYTAGSAAYLAASLLELGQAVRSIARTRPLDRKGQWEAGIPMSGAGTTVEASETVTTLNPENVGHKRHARRECGE
jgi:hypothetical protein